MQAARLGQAVDRSDLRRGDLVFWPGHVAMMIDKTNILHANAHHMAVKIEPLDEAITRIESAGVGAPTGFRRV
jgi:cell wall-associated NlpC family hydrolase